MSPELIARFISIVGEKHAAVTAVDKARFLVEPRDLWPGESPLVLRPASTEEVSRIMVLASETHTAIVPQSGNTGLVGGQVAVPGADAVVLSTERMTNILRVDAADNSITVQAGCILKSVQEAAAAVERLFPLSLASEGSCRIGGNLSSNAGGLNVLAYGNARDLCLGLEVVLPDGRVWNGLRSLRKDNTGYDLKNLFIGAEGTLGIITAAVLKLFAMPQRYDTAFIAVPSPEAALELLGLTRTLSGNRVIAFELMPRISLDFALKHMAVTDPLAAPSPWYVLTELADAEAGAVERIFEQAMARGIVTDGTTAQTVAQRQSLWDIREKMPESQKFEGGSIKHDISVPVSKIPAFIEEAGAAVARFMPTARLLAFGHMGDGNLHFNVSQPVGMDKQAFLDQWEAMNEVVFAVVEKYNGSISAEHGVGLLKRDHMAHIKSPVELGMMQEIKRLFDPLGIMNPGKVLP